MAKYGDLIRKARETDNQVISEPDDQIPVKPDDQTNEYLKTTNQENKPDDQMSVKPDNQTIKQLDNQGEVVNQGHKFNNQLSGLPDSQTNQQLDEEVNLCVKVPKSLRRHWAAEAKRHGITMTEVMTEALIQRFGKPDNQ